MTLSGLLVRGRPWRRRARPALTALARTVPGQEPDLAGLARAVEQNPDLDLDTAPKAVQAAQDGGREHQMTGKRRALVDAPAALVTEAGNTSDLILDPDPDSFCVMDSLVVRMPNALGHAAHAWAGPSGDSPSARIADQAVLAGGPATAAGALEPDLRTATANTSDGTLASSLAGLHTAAEAVQTLQKTLTSPPDEPSAVDPSAATAAVEPVSAAPDGLLAARTDAQSSHRSTILAVTVAGLLLAAWFAAAATWGAAGGTRPAPWPRSQRSPRGTCARARSGRAATSSGTSAGPRDGQGSGCGRCWDS